MDEALEAKELDKLGMMIIALKIGKGQLNQLYIRTGECAESYDIQQEKSLTGHNSF